MSTFLSSFVSNNLEAHKLEIRQKEYYERLLGLPPELTLTLTLTLTPNPNPNPNPNSNPNPNPNP